MLRVMMALRLIIALMLPPWAVSRAQGTARTPSGANGNGGGNGSNATRVPTPSPDSSKPIFVSGRALLSDGNLPAEGVTVERVCGTSITNEARTDSKGRFTLQLGANRLFVQDASSNGNGEGKGGGSEINGGCELRAVLQGYRSDSLSLNNRHDLDDPNVGTIVLHPLARGEGRTVSATSGFAPKRARQAYEKGLADLRRNQPEKAQKDFTRALEGFPRFAAAWFELGQTYERRARLVEARDAYNRAVAADANYANPYERLYVLDLTEGKWQQAADTSEKVLRLDPIDFPKAYYFNALANAHLQNLAAAEKSAREAARLEGPSAEPRAHYVLGMVLASRGNFTAAAESLRTFLKTAPEGPEQKVANRILSMIESREAAQKPAGAN